jgi:transposase
VQPIVGDRQGHRGHCQVDVAAARSDARRRRSARIRAADAHPNPARAEPLPRPGSAANGHRKPYRRATLLVISEWVWFRVLAGGLGGGRVVRVSDDLVPDDLWERVAPLLPPRPPRRPRYPDRLPSDDRAALRGIIYVPRKSVTCADVPTEMIGCIGGTCWRRLRDRTEAGVRPRLHSSLNSAGPDCRTWTTRDRRLARPGFERGLTPDLARSTAPARAPSTM